MATANIATELGTYLKDLIAIEASHAHHVSMRSLYALHACIVCMHHQQHVNVIDHIGQTPFTFEAWRVGSLEVRLRFATCGPKQYRSIDQHNSHPIHTPEWRLLSASSHPIFGPIFLSACSGYAAGARARHVVRQKHMEKLLVAG